MKLPTCELCGRPILPGEPAMHRNGRPAQHQRHYSGGYTPQQRGRWSELIAATRELAEGSGGLAFAAGLPVGRGDTRRGRKPSMSETESMQYQREERRRRARR